MVTRKILLAAQLSLMVAVAAFGETDTYLDQLRKRIDSAEADWKAGPTSVSALSIREKEALCGLLFAERPGMSPACSSTRKSSSTTGITEHTFDWRHQDKVTAVRNQGLCGSGWAFAAVGAMESAMLIADQSLQVSGLNLSEQFVISCSKRNFGCCGGYMKEVYPFLLHSGTPDEACMVYDRSGSCLCGSQGCVSTTVNCQNTCPNWSKRTKTISGWQWVNATAVVPTVDQLKEAVKQGPVPVGMDIYSDFFWYAGGIYEHVAGERVGGHAVTIIGWEDPDDQHPNGRWIVKNSWGTSWGESGFFRITWGDSRIGMDAAMLEYVAKPCVDGDGDGHSDFACGGSDCNDGDDLIHPGATEICDGEDNNCDGRVDEGYAKNAFYLDGDADGYGGTDNKVEVCGEAPIDYVAQNGDCNDDDPSINPGAEEVCDGIDNNCNGTIDDGFSTNTFYQDTDGDGYGTEMDTKVVCEGPPPPGYVARGGDCNDTDATVHPAAAEECGDNVDNNCNGETDEECAPPCLDKGSFCADNDECCSERCRPDGTCR
ncbi:MAG: hypothetical protein GF344_14305 [Chitinivibrionales bacterium]|nr:hypothetical protein [Chitinivibrionales bacterium]MBD3357896.1 hypothetical protein [Chitinivibrionales bacterium]